MNLRFLLGVAVAGLALSVQTVPVAAQETAREVARDRDPFEKLETINPDVLLKGIIREDDVSLLFQHVRESMAAAARGEEARESEAMTRRSEEIQREIAARGRVLAGALLSVLESAAKQMIREAKSDFSSGNAGSRSAPRSGASY